MRRCDCMPISRLDGQREKGDAIFGGGLLLSERAAAERAAAERVAAERVAAERAAAERWTLSDGKRHWWPNWEPRGRESDVMELKETNSLMESNDYRERFRAEYWQLKLRYEKLRNFVNKIEAARLMGWPEPRHDCPVELLREQQKHMGRYLSVMEKRALIEKIEI